MPEPKGHKRVCPTRIDGAATLFTHRVSLQRCQDRQQARYHKCFSCAYNNQHVAQNGEPTQTSPSPRALPAPKPALPVEEPVPVEPKRGAVAAYDLSGATPDGVTATTSPGHA